jgi:hypothetical protein
MRVLRLQIRPQGLQRQSLSHHKDAIFVLYPSFETTRREEMDEQNRSMMFSCAAIGLGALGMFVALFAIYAGPFTPQPDIGTSIGEIAGNIRAAALRAVQGLPQPESVVVQPVWDIDRILMASAPAMGVLGVVMAITAYIRREPARAATCGMVLSVAAIFVQVVLIVALLIAGAIILVGILQNLDSIIGG